MNNIEEMESECVQSEEMSILIERQQFLGQELAFLEQNNEFGDDRSLTAYDIVSYMRSLDSTLFHKTKANILLYVCQGIYFSITENRLLFPENILKHIDGPRVEELDRMSKTIKSNVLNGGDSHGIEFTLINIVVDYFRGWNLCDLQLFMTKEQPWLDTAQWESIDTHNLFDRFSESADFPKIKEVIRNMLKQVQQRELEVRTELAEINQRIYELQPVPEVDLMEQQRKLMEERMQQYYIFTSQNQSWQLQQQQQPVMYYPYQLYPYIGNTYQQW